MDAEAVQHWVEANLHTIRSIEDIASGLSVHPETLRKLFARSNSGQSLWDYVLHRRAERMKHLLSSTEMKCLAICLEVGIDREDTGSKLFKALVGMTMKEYRDMARNNAEMAD